MNHHVHTLLTKISALLKKTSFEKLANFFAKVGMLTEEKRVGNAVLVEENLERSLKQLRILFSSLLKEGLQPLC